MSDSSSFFLALSDSSSFFLASFLLLFFSEGFPFFSALMTYFAVISAASVASLALAAAEAASFSISRAYCSFILASWAATFALALANFMSAFFEFFLAS